MDLHKDNQKDKKPTPLQYHADLFHNDQRFFLIYKKIEHAVAAVFLVTNLIEQDPILKDSIRTHSLSCLNKITSLIGKANADVSDFERLAAHVLHLNSLLDIGFWAGHISHMNLAIVQQEISSIYSLINEVSADHKNSFFIHSSFFKTNDEILQSLKEKDKKPNVLSSQPLTKHAGDLSQRPVASSKGQDKRQTTKDISKSHESHAVLENKGHRRDSILALLRGKGNLTIKDFVSVVPEYSEKTIQRELQALVEEGVVRRVGERRWSTYSLAV